MNKVIQPILIAAIIILGYLVVESIMRPIRFKKQVEQREDNAIQRLKDIRTAQEAFRDIKKVYTGSFDTLEMFMKNDSFTVVKSIGTVPEDWMIEMGLPKATEKALKEGIIARIPAKFKVSDSLKLVTPIDSLRYAPHTGGTEFNIVKDEILTSSNLTIQAIEVSVMFDDLLQGLNKQKVLNYKDQKSKLGEGFLGVKFGSLTDGSITGNWE